MNIAELKGQIASLEAEQKAALQTYHETTGALKLARHQLARIEKQAAAEAEKANAVEPQGSAGDEAAVSVCPDPAV